MRNWRLFVLAAATAALGACDVIDAPIDPISGAPSIYPEGLDDLGVASAALSQVGSCQDVDSMQRAVLKAELVAALQASFASALESREHCSWFDWGGADMAAVPKSESSPGTSSGTPAYSETNNQVAGVDEADLVKTDGKHLYQVGAGAFRIIQAWPAASTKLVAKIAIEGTPKKLFVAGDRALVYSSLGAPNQAGYNHWYDRGECTHGYDCVPTGDGRPTKITILDIADRSAPRPLRELRLSSSFLAARRIGSAVHTVVTFPLRRPSYQMYPSRLRICDSSRVEIYHAFRGLLLANLAELAKTGLDGALPTLEDRVLSGAAPINESPLAGCRGFLRSPLADGANITSLLSLAIDDERPAHAVSVVSRPGVVYANADALYLAEPRAHSYWGWYSFMPNVAEATTVHKFAIKGGALETRYVASGIVRGRLLNQFALDEQQGFLRLASTSGSRGGALQNTLTVLEQRGATLAEVGLVDGIARGEDIRSVRFDGDRGYIVTFKKTDPLFVLDLADPRSPRVLGELEIPGFSTYMHRLDANHLLTIGYDASDQGSFAWFTGIMLQIFDVGDPKQPKLKFKHQIGTRGSTSEAATNHLAFTYYAPKNLLALPMTICDGGNGNGMYGSQMSFSGLMVFDVTAAAGFGERGRVDFPLEADVSCSNWWTHGSSAVQRSVIIDNFVYALSDGLLKVNDLSSLGSTLASVPLN